MTATQNRITRIELFKSSGALWLARFTAPGVDRVEPTPFTVDATPGRVLYHYACEHQGATVELR